MTRLFFVLALLLMPLLAEAQSVQRVVPGPRLPRGYEQLTLSSDTSTPLASVPSQTNNPITLVVICVESNAVRFRDDGTAPTAAIGMPIGVGACYSYTGDPTLLRFFRQTASNAIVNAMYYSDR